MSGVKIIEVEKIRSGAMESSVCGSGADLLMGIACISNHIMRDLCENLPEKFVAEEILHATKMGIERYLEEQQGGADHGEV